MKKLIKEDNHMDDIFELEQLYNQMIHDMANDLQTDSHRSIMDY